MPIVKNYLVRYWGGPDGTSQDGRARIQLNDDTSTLGFINFYDEGKPIPNDFKNGTGPIMMHLAISHFAHVIDLLRNESPVYISSPGGSLPALLNTISEPVGEGE